MCSGQIRYPCPDHMGPRTRQPGWFLCPECTDHSKPVQSQACMCSQSPHSFPGNHNRGSCSLLPPLSARTDPGGSEGGPSSSWNQTDYPFSGNHLLIVELEYLKSLLLYRINVPQPGYTQQHNPLSLGPRHSDSVN